MNDDFQTIVRRLVGADGAPPLSGIDAPALSASAGADDTNWLARTNGDFLLSLCGGNQAETARGRLAEDAARGSSIAGFLLKLNRWILEEQNLATDRHEDMVRRRHEASVWAQRSTDSPWNQAAQQAIWRFLFPEGVDDLEDPDEAVRRLREWRKIRIDKLNSQPIEDPMSEMVMTSNILLTVPSDSGGIENLPFSAALRDRIKVIAQEDQIYWFDHPIPLDIETEANEILYGLTGLNEAMAFEKASGGAAPDARMTVVLSVSVTHAGLKTIARDYLREAFASAPRMPHLDVYVFSEEATDRLLDEVLKPAVERYMPGSDCRPMHEIWGVDGEYGRHYSFLKAVTALWQVLINPEIRATFKIDLDQVFPQQELVGQGGGSAFDHFRTPLWGALGRDAEGREVELGMLAGALVNERDIDDGLFTPDVKRPFRIPDGEAVAFFKQLPMAISTEAEMMARYSGEDSDLDGRSSCLHRIHVTGGTNGILVDALRRHRPFTPTFVGRAEDQAYLLSVLFSAPASLRYAHSAGLIMRHDKEAFAGLAIEAAKVGKTVGDLIRTLYFSRYAEALPWGAEEVKRTIDPFTGCFVSPIPTTLVALRLALRVGELLSRKDPQAQAEALELMQMAADRLEPLLEELIETPHQLVEDVAQERAGWNLFYDLLDAMEQAISAGDPYAQGLGVAAKEIVRSCHVETGPAQGS